MSIFEKFVRFTTLLLVISTDNEFISWNTEFFKEAEKAFSTLAVANAPAELFTLRISGIVRYVCDQSTNFPELDKPAKSKIIWPDGYDPLLLSAIQTYCLEENSKSVS